MDLTIERPPEYHCTARPELVQHVPENARAVLDLGCGDGSNLALLFEHRENLGMKLPFCYGIDSKVDDVASRRLWGPAIHLYKDDLWDMVCRKASTKEYGGHWWDCIIMGDILEHMPYPVPFLQMWADGLSSYGTLVMSVPNMGWIRVVDKIMNQSFSYATAGHFDADHKRFFCKEDIRKLVEHCGLTIEKLQPLSTDVDVYGHKPHTPLKYNDWTIEDPSADLIEQLSCYQWLCVAKKGDSNG